MSDKCLKIKGYHGTLMDNAKHIQKTGFLPSSKEIEWLGFGIYFFVKFKHAKDWAVQQKKRLRSSDSAAVLSVDICATPAGILDLDDYKTMRAFEQELCDATVNILSNGSGGAPKFEDDRKARCFFCNLYASVHREIKIIAYSFPREYCNDVGFPYIVYKRQLCVIDETCIRMQTSRLEAV